MMAQSFDLLYAHLNIRLLAEVMETGSPQLLPGSGTQASTEYG